MILRARSEDAVVALAADVVQSGATTVTRLKAQLNSIRRAGPARMLGLILDDIESGAYSALERRYLREVESAHRLPSGDRQRRVARDGAVHLRDLEYPAHGTIVELDGRLGHEWAADRWSDLQRDLLNLADGDLTVRLGWVEVLRPCRVANLLGEVLRARGWDDHVQPCGPGCDVGSSPAAGTGNLPGYDAMVRR